MSKQSEANMSCQQSESEIVESMEFNEEFNDSDNEFEESKSIQDLMLV
jgi:hypothetical protein